MASAWRLAVVAASLIAGAPAPAAAEERADCSSTIGRENLVPCVLAASLDVRAEAKMAEALRGRRTASAVVLPSNPTLTVSGAHRQGLSTGQTAADWYATLSQEIELAGQRSSRIDEADDLVLAQSKRVLLTERDVAASAWTTYFQALAAREQQTLAGRLVETSQRMATLARARADEGVGSRLDAELAAAAATRLLYVKWSAERAATTTRARLAILVGRGAIGDGTVDVGGDLTPLRGLPSALVGPSPIAHRPEVQLAAAQHSAMLHRAEAFRRARIPNPTLSLIAQNDGFNERVFGMGVSVPIPLPSPVGRTNAGEIAEAEALAQRADVERARAERDIAIELAEASATYAALLKSVEALPPERVVRTEQALRDLQVEIEAGRMGLRDGLVAQQALVELLHAHIEQRRALCIASVAFARALGLPLEGGQR